MHQKGLTWVIAVAGVLSIASCGGGGGSGSAPPPVTTPAPPPVQGQTCITASPPNLERSLVDRVDDVEGPQLHLVYALPADGTDAALDTSGQIQTEMEAAQQWLQQQTGRCMRIDTFQGAVDVTFVRFSRTNQQLRDDPDFVDQTIELEFEGLGLDDPEKVYVVYYGGSTDTGACGGAAAIGGPAMQFLATQTATDGPLRACQFFRFVSNPTSEFRGTWAGVAVHETFHSVGMVPTCAPDHDDIHPLHLEPISSDLMAFDGTGFSTYTLDAGRDQYYDHSNAGCPDLADSAAWTDAPAGADPLPNRITYTEPNVIACQDESITASATGGAGVPVRFVNTTAEAVFAYRLDASGTRELPTLLDPYSQLNRGTAVGEVFVVTNAASGECIGLHEMVPGTNRVVVAE